MQRALVNLANKNCFLFDLDGTLVDSTGCHERAFLSAFALEKVDLADAFCYERYKGLRTQDVFLHLGIEDVELVRRLTDAKQRFYREGVEAGDVDLASGAHQVLKILEEQKRRVFLVTGASRRSTQAVMSRLGILKFFENLITGDDVKHSKPAPDCYLKCMESGRINVQEAIAIEDALAGIESAKAAGLEVIVVNNPSLSQMPEYVGTFFEVYDALSSRGAP